MTFYVNNSYWPVLNADIKNTQCATTPSSTKWTDLSELQPYYIPSTVVNNPYANPYSVTCSNINITANNTVGAGGYYVSATVNNATNAAIIAGRLPLAYITKTPTTPGTSTAMPPAA